MEGSILTEVKKILNITETDITFDLDIIMHINSAFSTLQQVGVGPVGGFMVRDKTDDWSDYISDNNALNNIKSYVCLVVRMLFDPPQTSFVISAMNEQIEAMLWRISTEREWQLDPVDPRLAEEDSDDE